ncbi:MAG: hypothetical protein WAV28_15600 [Sedimentisphaerales bacterium]
MMDAKQRRIEDKHYPPTSRLRRTRILNGDKPQMTKDSKHGPKARWY